MKMKLDGASKKATAKAKKGSSPNQSHDTVRGGETGHRDIGLFGAAVVCVIASPLAPGRWKVRPCHPAGPHLSQHDFKKLRSRLNVGADNSIPILGDQRLGR